MRILKTFSAIVISLLVLTSCSKEEDFDSNNLIGTWYECYDDIRFQMDGSTEYTFADNGQGL